MRLVGYIFDSRSTDGEQMLNKESKSLEHMYGVSPWEVLPCETW